MTDASITVAPGHVCLGVSYIRDLLNEVRSGDQIAASELVDFVEHVLAQPVSTVAMAFGLHEAKGAPQPEARALLYRGLGGFLGEGLSLRKQAEAIRQKQRRYIPKPNDQGTQGERAFLWRLAQIGSPDLSERHIRRILGGR